MAPTPTGGADRVPAASSPQRGGRRRTAPTAGGADPAAALESRTAGTGPTATGASAQAFAPITDTATAGYDEEIPPPLEPPPDEAPPPPPDEQGPTAATVDPIRP